MDEIRTTAEILELKRQILNLNIQLTTIRTYLICYLVDANKGITVQDVIKELNLVQETVMENSEIKESIDKYNTEIKEFEELIKMSNSFSKLFNGEEVTEVETKMYALEDTDFIFGPNVTYTDRSSNNDKYGALKFDTRFTIKGSSQPVKIVMDKPGAIVVFYASTGDEEREIVFRNATEDLDSAFSDSVKQVIRQAVFEVPAAGTYYIINPAGGMYIHGLIVAKNK